MPSRDAASGPDPIIGMLADALADLPGGVRWLLLGCEPAILAEIDSSRPEYIRWVATDVIGRDAACGIARSGDLPNIEVWDDPIDPVAHAAPCDAVAIAAPPDRNLARRWLLTARDALSPGGALLLAGANEAGIRSIIADAAALFGPPAWEDYRKKRRIAQFSHRADAAEVPAWVHQPGVTPGSRQAFTVAARGFDLPLVTVPGVFAGDRLDAGTALLLDALDVRSGSRVLDVGCGNGVIGIVAAKLGAGEVDLTDANLLAVAAAQRNVARTGVSSGRAVASDVYSALPGERYDLIVSNPPFHHGKAVDYRVPECLIDEAPAHLNRGGRLVLVANAFLRYERRLAQRFARVEILMTTPRFRVLSASAPRS